MSITLRIPAQKDVPALSRLAEETFCQTFAEGFQIGYSPSDLRTFLTASYAQHQVEAWICDPKGQVMIAEDTGGRLVGYTHCGPNTLPYPHAADGDFELKRLYVRRELQGSGVGRALFEQALRWFDQRTVLLGVWSENLKAQRFYAHYGFQKVGEYTFMVGSTADKEFILRRAPPEQESPAHSPQAAIDPHPSAQS